MIIAISGLKRSGKSVTSHYISNKYGFKEYAFAGPIKEACSLLFGWSMEHMENHKEEIDPIWGVSPRQAMQWMGTEAFQYSLPAFSRGFMDTIGRNFWVKKFEQVYNKNKGNYLISDFRFPHEAEALKKYNAITVKVVRDSIKTTDLHESEIYIQSMNCDFTLYNNGTLQKLYDDIDKIMMELMA